MNVLILGYGQTGSALAKQLQIQGHHVTAVSRHAQTDATITHLQQDILSLDLSQITYTFDWIYVILAPKQRSLVDYQHTYLDTVRPIYQALKDHPIQKIVWVSSTSVYGQNQGQEINDETVPQTSNPYGQILIASEQLSLAYWQKKLIIVRPSGLYQANSQYLQKQAEQAQKIEVGHWTNRIHREDVVGFLAYLMQVQNPDSSYLVSDLQPTLQHELWQAFRAVKGFSPLVQSHKDLPITGKRIQAKRLAHSGYQLRYPTWKEGYTFKEDSILK